MRYSPGSKRCELVQMKLRGQGEGVAASDSIAMMAGSEGTAVAQCIESSSCSAPYLQVRVLRTRVHTRVRGSSLRGTSFR